MDIDEWLATVDNGPQSMTQALSQSTTPRSVTPFSNWSSNRSRSSVAARLEESQRENERLRAELELSKANNRKLKWQRDTAVGHVVMLKRDYGTLKRQMNAKEERRKQRGRGLRMHGLMTSEDARQEVAEEDAKRTEKKQKTEAAKQRRQEKTAARKAQQDAINGTEIYKGRLSGKSKAELEDIATALSLPTDGARMEIMQRIKEHLDSTPNLRQN